MADLRILMGKIVHSFLLFFGITVNAFAVFQFDGEILQRLNEKAQCTPYKPFDSQRKVSAAVYAPGRLVHLPGTSETLINEWTKVGEVSFVPVSMGETPLALVEWESSPKAIDRSCKFVFLPNRPPVFSSLLTSRTNLSPGTKTFVQTVIQDPEKDGCFISWNADKGRWIRPRTRSTFNYYVAPMEEGEVKLSFTATDVFGAFSEKTTTLYVGQSESKDLYQLRYAHFLFESGDNQFMDACQDARGNVYVLEKTAIEAFTPQGTLLFQIKNMFSQGIKIKIDSDGYLYVLDLQTRTVLKLNRDGKILSSFTDLYESGDLIRMENPVDFELTPQGRIMILDQTLCRVLVFTAQGEFYAAIGAKGNKNGQFVSPSALELSEDLLYVLDPVALKVKVFNKSFEMIQTFTLSERYQYTDLALDSFSRSLYVTGNLSANSSKIQGYVTRFDLSNNTSNALPVEKMQTRGIKTISIDLDGRMMLTGLKPGPVIQSEASGQWKASFLLENIEKSSMLCSGPLGSIYFQSDKGVKRLDYFGWVDASYDNDSTLLSMAVDPEENLYLLNKDSKKIVVFDQASRRIKDIALPLSEDDKLLGFGVDASKNIYLLKKPSMISVLNPEGDQIRQQDLQALTFSNISQNSTKLFPPYLFHVDLSGNVYLIDKTRKMVLSTGKNFSNPFRLGGEFKKAVDISVDLKGDVYILDSGKGSVYKYDSQGTLKREIELSRHVKYPAALTAFGDGEIAVLDDSDKSVYFYK